MLGAMYWLACRPLSSSRPAIEASNRVVKVNAFAVDRYRAFRSWSGASAESSASTSFMDPASPAL